MQVLDDGGFIRVVEFLYALKIFIAAGKRLTETDFAGLEKIMEIMEMGETDK